MRIAPLSGMNQMPVWSSCALTSASARSKMTALRIAEPIAFEERSSLRPADSSAIAAAALSMCLEASAYTASRSIAAMRSRSGASPSAARPTRWHRSRAAWLVAASGVAGFLSVWGWAGGLWWVSMG